MLENHAKTVSFWNFINHFLSPFQKPLKNKIEITMKSDQKRERKDDQSDESDQNDHINHNDDNDQSDQCDQMIKTIK